MRRLRAAPIPGAVAIASVLALLAGCAAPTRPEPTPRTTPDSVERAAVQRTTQAFAAETGDARLPWVQLWTVAQFPTQMQLCVGEQSHGQLAVTFGRPPLTAVSYHIVGSGSEPDEAESARIIARCAGATPLDDRVLRLLDRYWNQLYSYELTVVRPCLLAHGYPVQRPPTRDTFARLLRAQTPWSPYDTVKVPTRFAWYALADACPPLSPALNLATSPG